MDTTSYLLGKKNGGGGGIDWSQLGYESTPNSIVEGYNYALQIKKNWVKPTRMHSTFKNDLNLTYMPLVDTSGVDMFYSTFRDCRALKEVPLLDTSSATTFYSMFSGCTGLVRIPVFDTSKVTVFDYAFTSCFSLDDESIDNILKMLINATSYTGTKTLKAAGLNSSVQPVSKIESMPSYQAFLDAGWTIGY